jgi:hypothetical protein
MFVCALISMGLWGNILQNDGTFAFGATLIFVCVALAMMVAQFGPVARQMLPG